VKDTAWCERAVQQTVDAFGRLDVLVNNAAFQEHAASLEDIDDERLAGDARHQHRRLLPHGARRAAAPEARGRPSSTPAR
jgi:NAD(P)-dependent dehydrogenase (short-subunit alcohol dehydrogenase family)